MSFFTRRKFMTLGGLGLAGSFTGCSLFGEEKEPYALESIAAKINVGFNGGKGYPALGGRRQLFVPDQFKPQKKHVIGTGQVHWRVLEEAGILNPVEGSPYLRNIFRHPNVKPSYDDIH